MPQPRARHGAGYPPPDARRALPLTALPIRQRATVLGLDGGHGFIGRLAALGFTPGAELVMVRNDGRGPIIVSVLDTQIALGRGQASRVTVRPVEVDR